MKDFKNYIGETLKGKKLHLTCDCLFPIDVTGVVVGYSTSSDEVIIHVDVGGKIIQFGSNHPKLKVEEL